MRRRNFISTVVSAAAVMALPVPNIALIDPYDGFLASLNERIRHVVTRDETTLKRIHIDPIEEIGGQAFRFVRLWVEEREQPLTWYHPY